MEHKPDLWVLVKFNEGTDNKVYYKILASWRGGYLDSDAWCMSLGIVKAEEKEGDHVLFYDTRGFVYYCLRKNYGASPYAVGVLGQMREKQPELNMTVIPFNTNFLELNYGN